MNLPGKCVIQRLDVHFTSLPSVLLSRLLVDDCISSVHVKGFCRQAVHVGGL